MIKLIKFLLFFCFVYANSQTINGKVFSGIEPVANANILIRSAENSNIIIGFHTSNDKGLYCITLNKPLTSIIIEVNSFTHESKTKTINILNVKDLIIVDFDLLPKTTSIKEIVIQEKISAIKVKNDTTIYGLERFKDGTERVVEDLIKKLPGIKVEENGTIKFNGKNIKKMLLDGDDLFDEQYVTGSRNISIDLLDKVEAIENYNDNVLLKGIKDGDDVVLNLKLKKDKTAFSGNANLGYGVFSENKYNLSVTGILLNKKIKSFGVSTFNNIGLNNTPYDFETNSLPIDSKSDRGLIAKQVINQGDFSSNLDPKFQRINNTFFTSANLLFKFSKKITLKSNLDFYLDKFSRINTDEVKFLSEINNSDYYQTEDLIKKPKMINGVFQLLGNYSQTLNWEYQGKISGLKTDFTSNSINNAIVQRNKINSEVFFTKHFFNITKRLKDNSALITKINFSLSKSPQDYIVTPGVNLDGDLSTNVLYNNQSSKFVKNIIDFKSEYLNSFSFFKWTFSCGYYLSNNNLNSRLSTVSDNGEVFSPLDFNNNLKYNFQFPYLDGSFAYKKNKFSLKFALNSQYYKIEINDKIRNNDINEEQLILSPQAKAIYSFSQKQKFIVSYSYSQMPQSETNLFEGTIQKGFRSFQNNSMSLDFFKTHTLNLGFFYNDLYNLTRSSLNVTYNKRNNNYFTKVIINPNFIITNFFLLNSGNSDYNIDASGEKYFSFIKTIVELNANYSILFDKNILNDTFLREIENRNIQFELTARRNAKAKVKFENTFFYMNNVFKITDNDLKNEISSFKNSFKAIFKIKNNLRITSAFNYLIQDLSMNNKYFFLDSEVFFTPKNKKFEFSIIARNLTNNKTYEISNISDSYIAKSSQILINRFVIANIVFKF